MHVESFVVCIVGKSGTRCRDGVKVLWCHSYLFWLVFEGSIPTLHVLVLSQKTFCDLYITQSS